MLKKTTKNNLSPKSDGAPTIANNEQPHRLTSYVHVGLPYGPVRSPDGPVGQPNAVGSPDGPVLKCSTYWAYV